MDYAVHGILQARNLEWIAFPFSRGYSKLRDQTQVSRIAGGFFTSWATREAQIAAVISTFLSSRSLIHSSVSVILLICTSVSFISVIVLFISVCLFFSSSKSLLNISYIISIFASINFLRSRIIFTIIVWIGRLLIFISFSFVWLVGWLFLVPSSWK